MMDEMMYRNYAQMFWNELRENLWEKSNSLRYLPIVFVFPNDSQERIPKDVYGKNSIHINEKTNTSSAYPIIYLHEHRSDNEIQQTIRHEIIHYYLYNKYLHHDDDSVMFWLLAGLFDGGAYKELSPLKKQLYDSSKPYFNEMQSVYLETHEDKCAMRLSMMLSIVDSAEENINNNSIIKAISNLKLVLSTSKLRVQSSTKR